VVLQGLIDFAAGCKRENFVFVGVFLHVFKMRPARCQESWFIVVLALFSVNCEIPF
jgi:hypothetical protein